jgi:hypothetical protein
MKYKIFVMGLILAAASANANALGNKAGKFGLGAIAGEPTGVSIKYWFNDKHTIDGAFAWSLYEDNAFQIHSDYLFTDYVLSNSEQWPVYYGLGARLMFRDNEEKHHDDNETVFGFRIPMGITYLFEEDMPYEFFFEIAPILDVSPDTELDLNASVGFRFYF